MIDLKTIIEIYKEKRIKFESESKYRQMWTVSGHSVIIQIKKGRRLLTCDCDNHSRFCGGSQKPEGYDQNPQKFDANRGIALCYHKESVLAFPVIKKMVEELDKKVDTFNALKFGASEDVKKMLDCVLLELEDLQKLRWVRQLKYR